MQMFHAVFLGELVILAAPFAKKAILWQTLYWFLLITEGHF